MKLFPSILALCLISGLALPARNAYSQSSTVDHLTQEQLVQMAHDLEAKAANGNGSASKKLAEYPNHFTMIALRQQSGAAEVHENFADFFFIVEGRARLISGGTLADGKTIGVGEIQGSSVQKGLEQTLSKGDVVHIPAGVPHQLMLAAGDTLVYFVIKVREK